jgi:hypothetical protein
MTGTSTSTKATELRGVLAHLNAKPMKYLHMATAERERFFSVITEAALDAKLWLGFAFHHRGLKVRYKEKEVNGERGWQMDGV